MMEASVGDKGRSSYKLSCTSIHFPMCKIYETKDNSPQTSMLNKLVQCTEVMAILKTWKPCQESPEISSCSVDGERVCLGSDKALTHRDHLAKLSF